MSSIFPLKVGSSSQLYGLPLGDIERTERRRDFAARHKRTWWRSAAQPVAPLPLPPSRPRVLIISFLGWKRLPLRLRQIDGGNFG